MRCDSAYYGYVRVWPCRLEAGHDGCHRGEKFVPAKGGYVYDQDYTTWTDDDMMWSLGDYIARGGNTNE